ncbi:TetR/AcrR family transcriptional regulator [Aminobacterium sp. MB27-C1]|uniref:TetR/AcrR family transcriptional regulator n=1 Tax=Aminobacterium sp. MB27-C1 TaxID=3070661 RepID=UPI001BCD2F56|nr:TetR/AcrR family transcriptional regulator [Aminobacterium sp. MB27-C1]MDD2206605.1 TetR/AcrR family transcriptional regulator [Aminobacterium sp.]MDD3706831.1 TetR/AcrR family transcriptional regulator [Aminobacterium sp.]WMI71094.1 TetR/AcrR family transcriptional regulator [Aminobacterium sp. MB27-C1]
MRIIRNKELTKKKILQAVERILSQEGFQELGINRIAREAGVDKTLIYRYFGGLSQLLKAFVAQGTSWPSFDEIVQEAKQCGEETKNMAESSLFLLKGYIRKLQNSVLAQEILKGELLSQNELSEETAPARKKQGIALVEQMKKSHCHSSVDTSAIVALLSAGLTYLMLRSQTTQTYLDIDIRSEAGWNRIERALEKLVYGVFQADSE